MDYMVVIWHSRRNSARTEFGDRDIDIGIAATLNESYCKRICQLGSRTGTACFGSITLDEAWHNFDKDTESDQITQKSQQLRLPASHSLRSRSVARQATVR
jgi:hypothetical protein